MERRRAALERCLGIEQKRIDLRNEEEKTQEPDFWENPDKAREQLRKVAGIKAWVDDYDAIRKDAEDLRLMPDFVKEGVVSEYSSCHRLLQEPDGFNALSLLPNL